MKQWNEDQKVGAQGELFIVRVDALDDAERAAMPTISERRKVDGEMIVGHSETGHHHVLRGVGAEMFETDNPLVCCLRLESPAKLEHLRSFDQHEAWMLPAGDYVVTRQRERSPEGWRQVVD